MTANLVLAIENDQPRLKEALQIATKEDAAQLFETMYGLYALVAESFMCHYEGLKPLDALLKQALNEIDWDEVAEHFANSKGVT